MSKTVQGALIGAAALILAAIIGYFAAIRPVQLQIRATQTAEAGLRADTGVSQSGVRDVDPLLAIDVPHMEPFNWVAPFEKPFPKRFWAPGTHRYTLEFRCEGRGPFASASQAFRVSNDAPILPGYVYLRFEGLFIDPLISSLAVAVINPAQETVASVSRTQLTESQARLSLEACSASIEWDGGSDEPLAPGEAYTAVIDLGPDY